MILNMKAAYDMKTSVVQQDGIDHGGQITLLERNKNFVALHRKAHSAWSGLAMPYRYVPAEIQVYEVKWLSVNSFVPTKEVIKFTVRKSSR